MEREEALKLQSESPADHRVTDSTIAELRSALAERDSTLLTTRGYVVELQRIYRDTLSACEDAEARVRDLELQLQPAKREPPPLVVISPPPLPHTHASAPFLAQPKPMTKMSPDDEAIVARLLSAIERLRAERDALRRDLHFSKVEHRMADDVLRSRLDAAEHEVCTLKNLVAASQESTDRGNSDRRDDMRRMQEELEAWRDKFERTEVELTDRAAELADNATEMESMRAHLREVEESRQMLIASCKDSSRIAISSLVAIQHLRSEMDQAEDRLSEVYQTNDEAFVTRRTFHPSEAREELHAAETRYSTQQPFGLLSDGCSGAEAMESQLQVLEERILRRTEQIGMLQHDTKRLETNLRLAEETIGELTADLETLGQERACLVDDCAQAREARDEALRRVEELEVEVYSFANHYDELEETKDALQVVQAEVVTCTASLETMVCIYAESVTRSRGLNSALTRTRTQLTTAEANTSAKEEARRLATALECIRDEAQSREEEITGETQRLIASVKDLEGRLAAAKSSSDALSQELETAQLKEREIQATLERVQDESQLAVKETQRLSSAVASLERELNQERSSHFETITLAQADFEREASALKAQVEKSRKQHLSLQAEHANVAQDFKYKLEEVNSRLAKAREAASSRESLELDLRRLKSEHADELLVLRSRLNESIGLTDSLRAQIQTATETIEDLESEIEVSAARYDASQVETHGLQKALAAARTHADEHDASIQALQREKIELQVEHTRLQAELDRLTTKHQYAEQQAKRSDYEVIRLKPEVERLRGEVAKLDEATQTAEMALSFKTTQYEQKLAMMQRELLKQQSHSQCQETIAELNEKIEYLEEMLKMKSVEIEENDDRFIEALKEKKRLTSKVDSLTRKVQSLQTKMAGAPPSTTSPPLPVPRPKTPAPPMPPTPSAGPSGHAPTRIPSSPAVALRSKTPEPSRSVFASRIGTPEPHVPPRPIMTYRTPDRPRPATRVDTHRPAEAAYSFSRLQSSSPFPLPSGGRKRRAPDDFDSPVPGSVEAIVASIDNATPRHLRRPANDARRIFTPVRSGAAVSQRSMVPQPTPLKRNVAPLGEATNSPRDNRSIGLGKPVSVSKAPPMRSWLSRTRAPSNVSADTRSTSSLGLRP